MASLYGTSAFTITDADTQFAVNYSFEQYRFLEYLAIWRYREDGNKRWPLHEDVLKPIDTSWSVAVVV